MQQKRINNTNLLFFTKVVVALFISFCSCKPRQESKESFVNKEFLTLNLFESGKFNYLYYKLNIDTGISEDYCEGSYKKEEGKFILHPDSLKNKEFEFELKKEHIDNSKLMRIKIETQISGDYLDQYKICLHSDSLKIFFKGVSIDTIFNRFKFGHFFIEIFLADSYLTGTPVPKYKSILIREIDLDSNFNFFNINIPISRQNFYYKNSGPIAIKDSGKYWVLVDSNRKILKGKMILH